MAKASTVNLPLKVSIPIVGLKQRDVAAAAGIDPSRLTRIIRDRVIPTARERAAICAVLGLPASFLFGGTEAAR